MNKINIVGERAVYWFKDENGNEVYELAPARDYKDRFFNGIGGQPEKKGYKYIRGSLKFLFDTSDGFMHPGEYAIGYDPALKSDRLFAMLSSGKYLNLSLSDLEAIKNSTKSSVKTYKGTVNGMDLSDLKEIVWQ